MIDRFSKSEFEAALPIHNKTGEPLWESLGLKDGEYTYRVNIPGALGCIEVRSSVSMSGLAASSGEDSIRCWLTDHHSNPLGSKVQKYVTRVPGWNTRMTKVLRELAHMAKRVQPCKTCSKPMGIFKVKKDGPNKGRYFTKCCSNFGWISA